MLRWHRQILVVVHNAMKETQKHRDVFEVYFGIKPSRSLEKCHQQLIKMAGVDNKIPAPALRTLSRWSIEFDWQDRILLREKEIAKGVESKMIKEEINSRAASIKSIRNSVDALKKALASAFYKRAKDNKVLLREVVEINNTKDLVAVATAIVKGEAELQNLITPEAPLNVEAINIIKVEPEVAKKIGDEIAKQNADTD